MILKLGNHLILGLGINVILQLGNHLIFFTLLLGNNLVADNHIIVLNERHLRKLLNEYFHYYNTQRTHLGLNKDSPETREVHVIGKIEKVSVAGGLQSFYFRKAA